MQLKKTDIEKIERFFERLKSDVYPELPSGLHTDITAKMVEHLLTKHPVPAGARVLDVGCGQGVALEHFFARGLDAQGIALGDDDVGACQAKGFRVEEMDQSFLDFPDEQFDLIWSRHCLEHSIMPYFTLSEMSRVLKTGGLCYVEVPAPDTSCNHQANKNHYSVLGKSMWMDLMRRSGLHMLEALDLTFQVPAGPDVYWVFISKKQ